MTVGGVPTRVPAFPGAGGSGRNVYALIGNGIPLETAFLVAEKDALIPAALRAAAKDAEARTAAALSSGFGRPREGATSGGTAQVIKSDVTRFTKADRDEIVRRTAAGERIVF